MREYKASEWRAFLEAAGLRVTDFEVERKSHEFASWVERMQMPAAERAALEADMLRGPAVREYFEVAEGAACGTVVSGVPHGAGGESSTTRKVRRRVLERRAVSGAGGEVKERGRWQATS